MLMKHVLAFFRRFIPEPLPLNSWLQCSLWAACGSVLLGFAINITQQKAALFGVVLGVFFLLEGMLLIYYFCMHLCFYKMKTPVAYFVWPLLSLMLSLIGVHGLFPLLPDVLQKSTPFELGLLCFVSVTLLLMLSRQLHKLVQRTEMGRLVPQINHHFLFNTLNRAVCLLPLHPTLAQTTLLGLSGLYRMVLEQKTYQSILKEIDVAKHYIHIEKMRLEKRLHVSWDISLKDPENTLVPSMLLQPLIENSIGHGIETLQTGGTVEIKIWEQKNSLLCELSNPAPVSQQAASPGHGVAQQNLARRLGCLYGRNYSFNTLRKNGRYFLKLDLPLKKYETINF